MLLHTIKVWAITVVLGLHFKNKGRRKKKLPQKWSSCIEYPFLPIHSLTALPLKAYRSPGLYGKWGSVIPLPPSTGAFMTVRTWKLNFSKVWNRPPLVSEILFGLGLKSDVVSLHLCFFSAEFCLLTCGGRSQHCQVCGSCSRSLTASTVTRSHF